MKHLQILREIFCQALLASHLTRRGRWQSAVKLMNK